MMTCKCHGSVTTGPTGTHRTSGPIGRMRKGPAGIHRMKKGPSGDFYDELQASGMSNRALP